jgi:hypothetical protein
LFAALAPASLAQAKRNKIQLTGTVTRQITGECPSTGEKLTVANLRQGKMNAGRLVSCYSSPGIGPRYSISGTITLRVGKLEGSFGVRWQFETQGNYCPYCTPPTFGKPPKRSETRITDGKSSEKIVIHSGSVPTEKGKMFRLTLF